MRVEENEAVGAHQVQTHASRLGAQQADPRDVDAVEGPEDTVLSQMA